MAQGVQRRWGSLLGRPPWGGTPLGLQIMRKNTCQIHDRAHLAYKLCVKKRANCIMVTPWVTTNA